MSDRGPSTSALCSWSAAVAGAWIGNSSDTDALHCASTIVQRCITLGKTLVYSTGRPWTIPKSILDTKMSVRCHTKKITFFQQKKIIEKNKISPEKKMLSS